MKPLFLILLVAVVGISASCDKDDDNAAANPYLTADNKYSFRGLTMAITDAEYLYADGDTYLYFKGTGGADYVQIGFAFVGGTIPVGAFTFNSDRYGSYIAENNFWLGDVTNADTPLGFLATGGSVIISNLPGGGHKITFVLVTDEGDVTGSYTGVLRQRGQF